MPELRVRLAVTAAQPSRGAAWEAAALLGSVSDSAGGGVYRGGGGERGGGGDADVEASQRKHDENRMESRQRENR